MAKKKKTREQKILADQRHVLYHLETSTAQVSHPTEKKVQYKLNLATEPHSQTSTVYAYVLTDIKKTAFITASIIAAQIILFFLINRV